MAWTASGDRITVESGSAWCGSFAATTMRGICTVLAASIGEVASSGVTTKEPRALARASSSSARSRGSIALASPALPRRLGRICRQADTEIIPHAVVVALRSRRSPGPGSLQEYSVPGGLVRVKEE
ncbi:hypothetical protein GCM10010452_43930 [Crossiella cryophila]